MTDNLFQNPPGRAFLERLGSFFHRVRIYESVDRHIVFLCGGPMTDGQMLRARFAEYLKHQDAPFRAFLAEWAAVEFSNSGRPRFLNLSKFENTIAEIADCVIIFPESVGSYAETGVFSEMERVREKTLVCNDTELQGESFLNTGPIATIDEYSAFKPTIFIEKEAPNFNRIIDRIQNRIPSKKRRRIAHRDASKLTRRDLLFLTLSVVYILRVARTETVHSVLQTVFGEIHGSVIEEDVSILIAAGYIFRLQTDEEYMAVAANAKHFLEFQGDDPNRLRAAVYDYYLRHSEEVVALMAEEEH